VEGTLIQRRQEPDGKVRVTFELPAESMCGAVSVVGDFNGWRAGVTSFQGRGSIRTASVDVEPGRRYRFRYLADGGCWFDDDAADDYERNELGEIIGVVDLGSEQRR
jgi:1,4-alpha-glucan branching enzyme